MFPKERKIWSRYPSSNTFDPRQAQLNKYLKLKMQKWPRMYIDTEESVVVLGHTVSLVCACFGIEAGCFSGTDWSISRTGSCGKENSLSGDKGLLHVALLCA